VVLYILSFLALSAVPLVLGAYGGHLAAEVVDNPRHRKNAMLIVWGVTAIGVVLAGCQQYLVYKSDKDHDSIQRVVMADGIVERLNVAKNQALQD
jgi:hypothetical protein